jgi:hypothetical protein
MYGGQPSRLTQASELPQLKSSRQSEALGLSVETFFDDNF